MGGYCVFHRREGVNGAESLEWLSQCIVARPLKSGPYVMGSLIPGSIGWYAVPVRTFCGDMVLSASAPMPESLSSSDEVVEGLALRYCCAIIGKKWGSSISPMSELSTSSGATVESAGGCGAVKR